MKKFLVEITGLMLLSLLLLSGCKEKNTYEKIADKVYKAAKEYDYNKGNLSAEKEKEMDKNYKNAKKVIKDIFGK